MDNCRIYVCISNFGQSDTCRKFRSFDHYRIWISKRSEHNNNNLSFQSVCDCPEIVDKFVLSMRSQRHTGVKILIDSLEG